MAFFSIPNLKVAGISACVPKNNVSNLSDKNDFVSPEDLHKIAVSTGIENRRVVDADTCTSDLCYHAAEKLIAELGWDKEDIGVLLFVSQTPDYLLPMTSTILQYKLGLPTSCISFDSTLGCSGYVYGLSIISSILQAAPNKKGLLLVGDTISKIVSPRDRSTFPLFGDAGTATALMIDTTFDAKTDFLLGSDGAGANAIIVPHGGQRHPYNEKSTAFEKYENNIEKTPAHLDLNGMDVFNFGISVVPKSVKSLLEETNKTTEDIDYFVFHQANKLMNETIRKKLKLTPEQVPYTLQKFANTSSATIPLTIVSELRDAVTTSKKEVLLCGFGVGLSWGSVLLTLDNITCPTLIEI